MRTKIVAGNWKMNMNLETGIELVKSLMTKLKDIRKCDVVFCPPFPLLKPVYDLVQGSRFGLGAQHVFWEDKGAYTGEVSADMLLSAGCQYVIIGHSERRKYFYETDETVNKRLKKALQAGFIPIVCIGETIEEREAGQTTDVIYSQLKGGLQDISLQEMQKIILAYEPVWAIGTGKTATPEQAVDVHQFIRKTVKDWYDEGAAQHIRIQYGGSVNDANAERLLGEPDIDGALVGGASLKVDSFAAIVNAGELKS